MIAVLVSAFACTILAYVGRQDQYGELARFVVVFALISTGPILWAFINRSCGKSVIVGGCMGGVVTGLAQGIFYSVFAGITIQSLSVLVGLSLFEMIWGTLLGLAVHFHKRPKRPAANAE